MLEPSAQEWHRACAAICPTLANIAMGGKGKGRRTQGQDHQTHLAPVQAPMAPLQPQEVQQLQEECQEQPRGCSDLQRIQVLQNQVYCHELQEEQLNKNIENQASIIARQSKQLADLMKQVEFLEAFNKELKEREERIVAKGEENMFEFMRIVSDAHKKVLTSHGRKGKLPGKHHCTVSPVTVTINRCYVKTSGRTSAKR